MEKIRINSIEMKGPNMTICVVKYMPSGGASKILLEAEATLNTKWQSQEVNYLQNDVGLNGEVSVLIEQKGQYTNITKVDFDSAKKGQDLDAIYDAKQGNAHTNGTYQKSVAEEKFRTPKEMVATELAKAVIGAMTAASVPISVKQAVNMYKEALELLG